MGASFSNSETSAKTPSPGLPNPPLPFFIFGPPASSAHDSACQDPATPFGGPTIILPPIILPYPSVLHSFCRATSSPHDLACHDPATSFGGPTIILPLIILPYPSGIIHVFVAWKAEDRPAMELVFLNRLELLKLFFRGCIAVNTVFPDTGCLAEQAIH
jgi:hypothetical protein